MWRMRLTQRDVHGKSTTITSGYYRSADDAARAYNAALKSAVERGIPFKKVKFNVIKADQARTDAKGKPKSRFQGVVVLGGNNRPRKFRGQLTVNNQIIKSDPFDSEEAAARWYDDQRAERGLLRVNFLEEQVAEFTNADFHPAPTARTAPTASTAPTPATVTLMEQHEPADVVDYDDYDPEWVAEDSDFDDSDADDSDSDGDDSEDDARDVGRATR